MDAYKNKTKCEGDDEIETQGQDLDEPIKKSRVVLINTECMKMVAEYKSQRKKNDDPEQLPEPVKRKQ